MFRSLAVIISVSLFLRPARCEAVTSEASSAIFATGTYVGSYVTKWQHDPFLDIPYVNPPRDPFDLLGRSLSRQALREIMRPPAMV